MITGSQVVGRVPAGGHVVIPRGGGCSALKSPAVRRQTADLPFVQVHQTDSLVLLQNKPLTGSYNTLCSSPQTQCGKVTLARQLHVFVNFPLLAVSVSLR